MRNKIKKFKGKNSRSMILLSMSVLMIVYASSGLFAQEEVTKESAASIIEQTLNETGIEAARAKFFLLKTQKESYAFEEAEFTALGNKLLKADRPREAVAVLEMVATLFPDSANVYRLLAAAHYAAGDSEESLEIIDKMRSIRDEAVLAAFLKKEQGKLAATAEEVIDRTIEATGGREAWLAVETMVLIFTTQSTRGHQARLVRMFKRPYFFRQGLEGSNRFTATDGESVWVVSDEGWRKIEENSSPYIRRASIDDWFIDYYEKGISYTFIGLEIPFS